MSMTQTSFNNSVNITCQDPVNENVMEKVRSRIRITKLGYRSKSVLPQVREYNYCRINAICLNFTIVILFIN